MLRDATRLDAPEELTVRGQFKEILRQYCTSRIRAMEPAELKMGKPWTEKGRTMFMMAGSRSSCASGTSTTAAGPRSKSI
jgi:hypothetical protein